MEGMERDALVAVETASEDWKQRYYAAGLDVSSRAGFLLGSYYTGQSLQPNLLSRGTRDQAIISGVAASVGYAWGASAHSFLRSTADRLPMSSRSPGGRVVAGMIVDAAAAAIGAATVKAVPPREHESSKRALIRLGGVGLTAAGLSGLAADSLERISRESGKSSFQAVDIEDGCIVDGEYAERAECFQLFYINIEEQGDITTGLGQAQTSRTPRRCIITAFAIDGGRHFSGADTLKLLDDRCLLYTSRCV